MQNVSMPQQEEVVIPCYSQGFPVNFQSDLFDQIVKSPNIMVSRNQMNLYSLVV